MKINNKIKLKLIPVAILISMISGNANAQWAVTNVNDVLYFSPTGIFTQSLGAMLGSVKSAVDSVGASNNIIVQNQGMQMKQQETYQYTTDQRNRIANGSAELAKKDLAVMPTLAQCQELTKNGLRAGTGGSALRSLNRAGGHFSGGGGAIAAISAKQDRTARESVKSTEQTMAAMIENKNKLDTCNGEGTINCPAGTKGNFAGGDTNVNSMMSNIDASKMKKNGSSDIANYTLDEKGLAVAKAAMGNAIYYSAPKQATPEQIAKNPSYQPLYDSVMMKLRAAYNAMEDIVKMRAETPLAQGSMAEKIWKESKTEYETIFPDFTWPSKPSLFEFLNFEIYRDFMGPKTTENQSKDEKQLLQDISRQMALNNFMLLQQYKQTEKTNILLGHILTQAVTPAKKEVVDAEYSKLR